jgi:PAS domain S-box-containing protein
MYSQTVPDRSPLRTRSVRLPSPIILAIGLAALLIMSATSIMLDVRSRSEARSVNHTLEVLNQLTDFRLLLRRAESSVRGYLLTGSPSDLDEYRRFRDKTGPALPGLTALTADNPAQTKRLADAGPLITRLFAIADESVRAHDSGGNAAVAALAGRTQPRGLMDALGAIFDQIVNEEQRLLGVRTEDSLRTERWLLATELCCALLVLLFAIVMLRDARRSSRQLESSLRASETANEALEAAVTERTEHLLKAHEEIRHTASVLRNTFNSMAEGVLVIDAKGSIVLSNAAVQKMLHYEAGMSIEQLRSRAVLCAADSLEPLSPNELPSVRALRGEHFDRMEIVSRHSDDHGPLNIMISGRPLRDASGAISGAALVYHDMTDARETEHKLHQAQKLDAIGKLTGGVAHDFNNMLTVISGTTEVLVEALADRPDLQGTAKLIDRAAERCAELIQRLLAFARKQPLRPRNVDVNATVTDIAKLLRPSLGEQIEIETVLEPAVATSHIDPSELANSLLNMAINARDAMPNGGKLLLETKLVVLDEAYARCNADVQPGSYVMVAVSDTGQGMPAEIRDNVFEPFFTTKAEGKGSGLGLSMVYGFVKQSGGHVKIYSEEGHGTTIKLYLPPANAAFEDSIRPATQPSRGSEIVLVVEDDPLVRNFAIAQLQSLGYQTVAMADGRAALAYVESGQAFDLLFTDVVMPGGMSGRELADAVAKLRPGTKVLYTSGYTDNAIVHHGRLDQGVMLLSKPYRKPQLAQMVRDALGRGDQTRRR